jgi:Bacterial protein of unknown function (DUF885)
MSKLKFSAILPLLLIIAACAKSPPAAQPLQPPAAGPTWSQVSERFIEEYLKAQPFFAVEAGRHEFDGQMPDFSAAGITAEIRRLHRARATLEAVDAAALKSNQRFERDYLLNVVDRDLFKLEKSQSPFRNPAWYLDNIDPDIYLSHEYAPLAVRMRAYIAYARTIPTIAADIQSNLRTPLPKTYVEFGIKAYGGFADFYRTQVPAIFAAVDDAGLQEQLKAVDTAAAKAMSALQGWFIAQRKNADQHFALGGELFAQMLKDTEQVDIPVTRIESLGQEDLERNLKALKEVCAIYRPRAALKSCVAAMAANKPHGSQVEVARSMLVELKAFVQKNDVATIPGNDEAHVAWAPPYNSANFAFISVPGPYDHGVAAIFNIAPADPTWSKAEQAAYIPGKATLLITSVHEVWPGHFLQFLHSNANPSKAEALWIGYAFAEGWAHYCEEMMVEMGLGRGDPQVQVAQLVEALWRDVRLLSAIGLHTHGMSVQESEKMFLQLAFQDPGNARQQAARGTYDPGYLNYTLGKLMIRKLRADWMAKKGYPPADKAHWHEFHDQFLSYGGPPIPMVRREMLGEMGSIL